MVFGERGPYEFASAGFNKIELGLDFKPEGGNQGNNDAPFFGRSSKDSHTVGITTTRPSDGRIFINFESVQTLRGIVPVGSAWKQGFWIEVDLSGIQMQCLGDSRIWSNNDILLNSRTLSVGESRTKSRNRSPKEILRAHPPQAINKLRGIFAVLPLAHCQDWLLPIIHKFAISTIDGCQIG